MMRRKTGLFLAREEGDVGPAAFRVLQPPGEGFADFVVRADDDDGNGGAGDGPSVGGKGRRWRWSEAGETGKQAWG